MSLGLILRANSTIGSSCTNMSSGTTIMSVILGNLGCYKCMPNSGGARERDSMMLSEV